MKIGTDHADLDYLSTQIADLVDPDPSPLEYAAQIILGDATAKGMGWLQGIWHWDIVSEAQAESLRVYVGAVNIEMPNNAGVDTEYTGKLMWPEREPEHAAGYVLDLSILIIKLITV